MASDWMDETTLMRLVYEMSQVLAELCEALDNLDRNDETCELRKRTWEIGQRAQAVLEKKSEEQDGKEATS